MHPREKEALANELYEKIHQLLNKTTPDDGFLTEMQRHLKL